MKALLLLLLSLWCSATAEEACEASGRSGKVLLFSIRAHSGRNAMVEFNNAASKDTFPEGSATPDHFRSRLLNDIPSAVKRFCTKLIVIEMQRADKAVAFAAFDAQDSGHLNSRNWFTPSRLVQTYPYWTGQAIQTDFGVARSAHALRNFFIHNSQEDCNIVSGLMGIGESSHDSCSWVTNGGSPPVLFYAREEGPLSRVVAYADQFIIYMTNDTNIKTRDGRKWLIHKPVVTYHWMKWSSWSSCTKTCGPHGTRSRTRTCQASNNSSANASHCHGADSEIQGCNTAVQCPVTYHWTKWSRWTSCTETCGPHGIRSRTRTCQASNNSSANASHCRGADNETHGCNTVVKCPGNARSDIRFTKREVRMCLKPEFIETARPGISSSGDCANHCIAQGSKCQGFRFQSQLTDAMCQLFVFTKCSHDVNLASCNKREHIYVRNQAGLPPGKLCPISYGHRHGSSVYGLVNAPTWHQGSARCSLHKGLTKYADVNDIQEAAHMQSVKSSLRLSFFVGGKMVSPADYTSWCKTSCKSSWEWVSCNTPIAVSVWDFKNSQPNEIYLGHVYTDIWLHHTVGIDSTSESVRGTPGIGHAMCECVDPFH